MRICLYLLAALLLFVPSMIQAAESELLCNGMTFSEAKQQFEMDLSPHVRSASLPALVRFGMHGKAEEVLDLLLKQYPELVFSQKSIDTCLVSAIAERTATEQLPVFLSPEERELNQRLVLSLLRVGAAHPNELALAATDENRREGERAFARAIAGYLNEPQLQSETTVDLPSPVPMITGTVDSQKSRTVGLAKFQGRTFDEWLHQFETSLEVKDRLACLPAFRAFSRTEHLEQIVVAIFHDFADYPEGCLELVAARAANHLDSDEKLEPQQLLLSFCTGDEAELLTEEFRLITKVGFRMPHAFEEIMLSAPVNSMAWEWGAEFAKMNRGPTYWEVSRFFADAHSHGNVPQPVMSEVVKFISNDSRNPLPAAYVRLLSGHALPLPVMKELAIQLAPCARPAVEGKGKTIGRGEQAYLLLESYFAGLNTPEAKEFFQQLYR